MKFLFLLGAMLCISPFLFAQNNGNNLNELPIIRISRDVDVHIISPEPIQYADISSHSIVGDMPVKNLIRIKLVPDSLRHLETDCTSLGVITIVGESFIAQYRPVFTNSQNQQIPSEIEIQPGQCRPLDFPGITLTTPQMKTYAMDILHRGKKSELRKTKAYGLVAMLNHVYTVGDHVFLDIAFQNKTKLSYDIDELRFKIEDKKITKATNVQSLEIKPEWQLYQQASFKNEYHNIYVFKKVTFPDNKILNVELSEKQVSGRTLILQIKYGDVLNADAL